MSDIFEFDEFDDCQICFKSPGEDDTLYCDGCSVACHTACLGLEDYTGDDWLCALCSEQQALEPTISEATPLRRPRALGAQGSQRRARARGGRRRNANPNREWERVWQTVWDRLNIDLDYPDDDTDTAAYHRYERRRRSERREFENWNRRFRAAERQGGQNRFRETAPVLLHGRNRLSESSSSKAPTKDESKAWEALDKATGKTEDNTSRKRKRPATASPVEPEAAEEPPRKLKKPGLRRAREAQVEAQQTETQGTRFDGIDALVQQAGGRPNVNCGISRKSSLPSTVADVTPRSENNVVQTPAPSFLQSLLKEVETSANTDDGASKFRASSLSTPGLTIPTDHYSPAFSSPEGSPTSSNFPSPQAISGTPPPQFRPRPQSPTPLASAIEPIFPEPEFSPSRQSRHKNARSTHHQSRNGSPTRSNDVSPSRTIANTRPKPSKPMADIQSMVRDTLRPYWKKGKLTKEGYSNINRSVCEMLYDKVDDLQALDSAAKQKWEDFVFEEVNKAISLLKAPEQPTQ
jgi:hypothetical protein